MNKWTINQDGYAMWCYHFPLNELKKRDKDFDFIIDLLLHIGMETTFLKLRKDGIESSLELISEFIEFYNHKRNNSKFYPNINSSYLSDDLIRDGEEYYFSSDHFLYNQNGEIDKYEISYKSIREILTKAGHPYDKKGITPLMHFKTGRTINRDLEVLEYDICFHLNSDIWLNKVPCGHCERQYRNEDLRKNEGLQSVSNYWYDNGELAEKNRLSLNKFMKLMHVVVKEFSGYAELNEGGMSLYENMLSLDGFDSSNHPLAQSLPSSKKP